MTTAARAVLIDALREAGFTLNITADGIVFRGSLSVAGHKVRCELHYASALSESPRVMIPDASQLPRAVIPHLDEAGELCVVDRRRYVADRYHLAGQALGLVQRAKEVLEAGLTRHATAEIALEFPQHFGAKIVSVEFGPYSGPVAPGADAGGNVILRRANDPMRAFAVTTDRELSFTASQHRPDTFGEFLDWAAEWDAGLAQRIVRAVERAGPQNPTCVVTAPNGVVAVKLDVIAKGTSYQKVFENARVWAQAAGGTFGRGVSIERLRGVRTDLEYVLARNGHGAAPLKDKSICLVGCGAIGGFLSVALAQFGAGSGQGLLTLIDPDALSASNVGRHLLGVDAVGLAKVDGCRDRVLAMLPGRSIVVHQAHAESRLHVLAASDIVVDATGEQGVSEMLNQWRFDLKPEQKVDLIHVWIAGQGAAVQTFFSSDPEFACRRCLQTDHSQPLRHWPLRPDAPNELQAGCGEAAYTPYGPSAPLMASGLAAKHVRDWSLGKQRPLLRTALLDYEQTFTVKPINPTRVDACPACGDRA